jgi:hypothetical protein
MIVSRQRRSLSTNASPHSFIAETMVVLFLTLVHMFLNSVQLASTARGNTTACYGEAVQNLKGGFHRGARGFSADIVLSYDSP